MILLCGLLACCTLLLTACLAHAVNYFLKREAALVDRLLKQGGVAPVVIEREKALKLPDPEIQPETWVDAAFFQDDVKEELEQLYPEVARMSHTQAKERYGADWRRIEQHLREQQTPLRAG